MNNTPETDELRDDIWASVYVEGQDFMQMLEHARTLERQRDRLVEALERTLNATVLNHRNDRWHMDAEHTLQLSKTQ